MKYFSRLRFSQSSLKRTTVLKFQSSPICLYFYYVCLQSYTIYSIVLQNVVFKPLRCIHTVLCKILLIISDMYTIPLNKAVMLWFFLQIQGEAVSIFPYSKPCHDKNMPPCLFKYMSDQFQEIPRIWITCSLDMLIFNLSRCQIAL